MTRPDGESGAEAPEDPSPSTVKFADTPESADARREQRVREETRTAARRALSESRADESMSADVDASYTTLSLSGTGYHKPLPPSGRVQRWLQALGLMLGRRLAFVIRDDHVFLLIMAAVVGIVSGGAAALLLTWLEQARAIFPEIEGHGFRELGLIIALPTIGGLLVGGLRHAATRWLKIEIVEGPPGVVEAIDQRGGRLQGRGGLVMGVGTGVTIASGGAVGHEGATVALGATAGSVVARFFGLRLRRNAAMVGAGTAAGLAAAFNAPLAGVIFTIELIFGRAAAGSATSMSLFIPLIVAAVSGTFTSHAIFGRRAEFDLPVHTGGSVAELGFYIALALAAGLLGPLMARVITTSQELFTRAPTPAWLRPGLGGLALGVLAAVTTTQVLGSGRPVIDLAVHGQLAVATALALIFLKIIASGLTFGSGGFGGVFMPSLYVGACMGTVVGVAAEVALGPGVTYVGAYAVVGMGAVLGALLHAPLTPIVMIFELTQDYSVVPALMLTCIISSFVARRFQPDNLYRQLLGLRGVILQAEAEVDAMKRARVRELMCAPTRVLGADAPLAEVRDAHLRGEQHTHYVLAPDERVIGYIDGDQLARELLRGELAADATARQLMSRKRLTLLYAEDTLAGAMLAFGRAPVDVLPVIDRGGALIGVLRRADVIAHYSDRVLGAQEEVVQVSGGVWGPDQEVGLRAGVILERVVVGREWAGASLAQLDLRGRAGVNVLEWARDRRVLDVDPRRPLREGDVLALAGTRDALLDARTLRPQPA
ncbi:MAG: chloride channel protein [Myxococcales bacterium]|nr:chloride channel protein [Myxococcales bacterium]